MREGRLSVGGWVSAANNHDIRLEPWARKVWVERTALSKARRVVLPGHSINGYTVKIVRHRGDKSGEKRLGRDSCRYRETNHPACPLGIFPRDPWRESRGRLRLIKFLVTAIRFSSRFFRLSNLKSPRNVLNRNERNAICQSSSTIITLDRADFREIFSVSRRISFQF